MPYAALTGLFVDESPSDNALPGMHAELVPLTISIVATDNLPLKKLVELRKREESANDGQFIRDLRHRFVERIEAQVKQISTAETASDAMELKRQFEQDMRDDYRALRDALKLEAQQLLGMKEIMTVFLGVGVLAAAAAGFPMPNVVSAGGAAATIGGLLATRAKFVSTRRKLLREHPIAYLYEAAGGIRL